jgi:hypothetical protein
MSKTAIRYLIGVCIVFAAILFALIWAGQFHFWSWLAGGVFGCCFGTILQFERMEGRL